MKRFVRGDMTAEDPATEREKESVCVCKGLRKRESVCVCEGLRKRE